MELLKGASTLIQDKEKEKRVKFVRCSSSTRIK